MSAPANDTKGMSTKAKLIIAFSIVGVVILIIALWPVLKKLFAPKAKAPTPGSTPAPKQSSGSSSVFPLRVGSSGPEVDNLQVYLNYGFGENLSADDNFGPLTQAAVKRDIDSSGTVSQDYYNNTILTWFNEGHSDSPDAGPNAPAPSGTTDTSGSDNSTDFQKSNQVKQSVAAEAWDLFINPFDWL